MKSSLKRLAAALLAAAALAGCDGEGETVETGDEENVAETKALFGDDRVADVLKGHLDRVPRNFAEFEALFKIGRACARMDSKEIFVVEESSSRASGHTEETDGLLPRTIVTGCNTGTGNPAGEPSYMSYSLMVALFSSPDVEGAADGDPMVFDRVEVMALDRKTGLYNFYVFTPAESASLPGIIQRVQLRPDDQVYLYTKHPKKKLTTKKQTERLCNNCHVNMGPLMNEMHEPWTNWVSTHKTLPASAAELSGETRAIVDEAVSLDGSHKRLSLANDLEKTMVAAIRVWNEGSSTAPGSGFVQANIDGDQPQGIDGMLESVFCETELQYASAFDTVPVELFVDPGAVAGGKLLPPPSYSTDVFPILMPVRSDMDKRIETALMKKKVLSQNTVLAIRLVDDRNDVFSGVRCGLYENVVQGLPTDPTKVDAHVRAYLRGFVDQLFPLPGSRSVYARTLLDDAATPDAVKQARVRYLTEATTAYQAEVAKLADPKGRAALKKRSQARKDAAHEMFAREANPMPLVPDEAL